MIFGWLFVIVPWLIGVVVLTGHTVRGMRYAWCHIYRPMITGS